MASTGNLVVARQAHVLSPWRHSFSTPTEDYHEGRAPKRRRTRPMFFRQLSLPESGADSDGSPRTTKRKTSILSSLFTFSMTMRRDKMPETGTPSPEQEGTSNSSQKHASAPCQDTLNRLSTQQNGRRRQSLAKIGGLFRRKRQDSGFHDEIIHDFPAELEGSPVVPVTEIDHQQSDFQFFGSQLESLAMNGTLRFQNRSVDALEAFDGPSNFYRGESYQNRLCTLQPSSPCAEQEHGDSEDKVIGEGSIAAPEDKTDARATNSHPQYIPKRKSGRPSSLQLYVPNFLKANKFCLRKRQSLECALCDSPLRTQAHDACEPSRSSSMARSTISASRFSTHPNPFGAGPDLQLRSIDDIGVLPLIEISPGESSKTIPHPTFFSTAGSAAGGCSITSRCSTRTSTRGYATSPFLDVARTAPSRSRSALSVGFARPMGPKYNGSRLPSLLQIAEMAMRSKSSVTTASETASEHEGMELKRMPNVCDDMFEEASINGNGVIGWQDGLQYVAWAESTGCGEEGLCEGRGRPRIRRG